MSLGRLQGKNRKLFVTDYKRRDRSPEAFLVSLLTLDVSNTLILTGRLYSCNGREGLSRRTFWWNKDSKRHYIIKSILE